MNINRIKDENASKDPIGLEVALLILQILVNTIPVIQTYQNNRNLELENQLSKIQGQISKLQDISKQIVGIMAVSSSQNHFNRDAKISIRDTLFLLKQSDFFRWMQLEGALKEVDIEIYKLKSDLRSYAMQNNGNLDIDVNDHLVTTLDNLLSNMNEMNFFEFVSGLNDSISEISKRLVDLDTQRLR